MSYVQTGDQNVRLALLKYYSSECLAHSTYIISLTIAFAATCSFLFPLIGSLDFLQKWFVYFVIWAILEAFAFIMLYMVGRTFWWGYLVTGLLKVKPKAKKDIKLEEGTIITLLGQIHEACADYVKDTAKKRVGMKFAKHFSSFRIMKKLLILYVVTVGITFLVFFVTFALDCP